MVAIMEGTGSGTKLLQSLLDSHPDILMVPGYALMYFYPYWHKYLMASEELSWPMVLDGIMQRFSSIIDTNDNPGSESLNQLGDGQDQSLTIDRERFCAFFLEFTQDEPLSPRTALIAIHYAYAYARGEDFSNKRILVYHIHVFFYVEKYLYKDFPDLKVIAAIRDPRANIEKRVQNSILKPNATKFRESDEYLMRQTAYRHIIRFSCEGLDSLSQLPQNRIRVFRHEDLVTRLEEVMRRLADFLSIEFQPSLLQPTWGGLEWRTTYYDFDSHKHVANPNVLSKDWMHTQPRSETFFIEGINFDTLNHYYGGTLYYSSNTPWEIVKLIALSLLPKRTELRYMMQLLRIDRYLSLVNKEVKNLSSLRSYQSNLFFSLKWTNDGIDFSKWDCMRIAKVPASRVPLLLIQTYYIATRLTSYSFALLYAPYNLTLRAIVSLSTLRRRLSNKRVLPEVL